MAAARMLTTAFHLLDDRNWSSLQSMERLNRHRLACRETSQIALIIDASALLRDHGARASVTPFNSGNAMRRAALRNLTTFVLYENWLESGWATEVVSGAAPRPSTHRPVELAIEGAIPNAQKYILGRHRLAPGEILK